VLVLVTGTPGAGKTLYALNWLRAKAEKEKRPVFYSGVTDVAIPGWVEFDPVKWVEVAKEHPGALLLIDEAQRVLRPRMHGSAVPEYVAALETHRHLGVDIVVITQHPMLIDANARRLVGLHFHVVRKFGTQASTVHEWASVKENCDKNRDDSTRHDFLYPKASFGWYRSAEVHTHKARIPARLLILAALPVVFLTVAYGLWSWYHDDSIFGKTSAAEAAAVGGPGAGGRGTGVPPGTVGPGSSGAGKGARATLADFIADHDPLVRGLPHTAPVYADVAKPVEAPYPAACVRMGSRCDCYTQQATRIADTPPELCDQIVRYGFFVSWKRAVPDNPPRAVAPSASAPPMPSDGGIVFVGGPDRGGAKAPGGIGGATPDVQSVAPSVPGDVGTAAPGASSGRPAPEGAGWRVQK